MMSDSLWDASETRRTRPARGYKYTVRGREGHPLKESIDAGVKVERGGIRRDYGGEDGGGILGLQAR